VLRAHVAEGATRSNFSTYLVLDKKLDSLNRSGGSFLSSLLAEGPHQVRCWFSYRNSCSNTTHQEIDHEAGLARLASCEQFDVEALHHAHKLLLGLDDLALFGCHLCGVVKIREKTK